MDVLSVRFTRLAVAVLVLSCCGSLHAQTNFQQLTTQKNAQAAAETWGYKTQFPTIYSTRPPDSAPGVPSSLDVSTPGISKSSSAGGLGGFAAAGSGSPQRNSGNGDAGTAGRAASLSVMGSSPVGFRDGDTHPAGEVGSATRTDPYPVTGDDSDGRSAAEPAQVTFSNGVLEIDSNNSSMSQILADAERRSGLSITGEVREQRVYGHYGPGRPSAVLTELLRGTGTNILVHEGGHREVFLTPRSHSWAGPGANITPKD